MAYLLHHSILVCLFFVNIIAAFPVPSALSNYFTRTQNFFSYKDGYSYAPLKYKHRDLQIAELNFLHTTDTHGWLGSHLTQEIYNADWGDFVNFHKNLKTKITKENKGDLILIDTGDKHDGNGLSDATVPNGIESTKIFNEQDYDLLTLGNHELYTEENSILEYYATATSSKFKNKFVSSNVEFILEDGITKVPFGSKYSYIKTQNKGFRILALSFMFNFRRFNARTEVTPFQEELKKLWFKEMVHDYPETKLDVLLVFGHLPITDHESQEINQLHDTLRMYYPNIVIQYFGGHSHIRDFAVFDNKSTGLQSGRFSETVGFLSIDNVKSSEPKFNRRYIDFNKESFAYHTNGSILATDTHLSEYIENLRATLNLNEVYGYIPENYYMYNAPMSSKNNIYNLLSTKVLPLLDMPEDRKSMKRFIMVNTGSVRFDLYRGNFTLDTEFIISPFENNWKYVNIPFWVAEQIEGILNSGANIMGMKQIARSEYTKNFSPFEGSSVDQCPYVDEPSNQEGYTTYDDYGCDGEDTIHNSMRIYSTPIVINSKPKVEDPNAQVDFVFYDFFQASVVEAINKVSKKPYSSKDCHVYGGRSTKALLRQYFSQFL